MPGAGRKVFVAGTVLSAADVNDYLMDQAVMRFSSSATRAASITAPTEGMVTYLDDLNRLQIYDGSKWETVIDEGIVTTKGDLLVASASNAITRLGVGADGTTLTASAGAPFGITWTAAAAAIPLWTNVASFTSSGTWSHPTANASNPKSIMVVLIGGGGGGGGGGAIRFDATWGGGVSGGGGGGAGAVSHAFLRTTGGTLSFTIGAGGPGGTAAPANGSPFSNGTAGTGGGTTSLTNVAMDAAPGGSGGGTGNATLDASAPWTISPTTGSGGPAGGTNFSGAGGASGTSGPTDTTAGVAGGTPPAWLSTFIGYETSDRTVGGGGGGGAAIFFPVGANNSKASGLGGTGTVGSGGAGGSTPAVQRTANTPISGSPGGNGGTGSGGGGGGGAAVGSPTPQGNATAANGGNGGAGAVIIYYDS